MTTRSPSTDQAARMTFTDEDRAIIRSYETLVPSLAELIGPHCEVVLHSLEALHHSVVCIANGNITGRSLGSPVTDFTLSMLEEIRRGATLYKSYFSATRDGRSMKSSTTAIRNGHGDIIGLLCVNIDLDVPFSALAAAYMPPKEKRGYASKEHFATDIMELLETTVNAVVRQVNANPSIPASQKNKHVVTTLFDKGIFEIRDAIQYVAERLNVSKHVIYLHIRNRKGELSAECSAESTEAPPPSETGN